LLAGIPARDALRAIQKENARFHLTQHIRKRRFTAGNPFKTFLNFAGTGATRPSCSAHAKSRAVPIHKPANLLLDLAFFRSFDA